MDSGAAPRQPSFETISGSFDALSEQFALCANLPAVDAGAGLMQKLDAVLEQLSTLNRKVDSLDGKFDGLDRKTTALNRNAVARALNNTIVLGDVDLAPLHSVITGEVIDGFPSSLNQLERLHVRDVDNLLRHLGESVVGSAADKKRNLKFASGLITRLH